MSYQQGLPLYKARCGGRTGRRWRRSKDNNISHSQEKAGKTGEEQFDQLISHICSWWEFAHFVIVKADAIVHPGAVVVHFQGASLAHGTVMGPGRWASWVAQLIFLLSPIIVWHCPFNNSCWEDLIDVALTNGYTQVIDIVATVYVGIKENLNNNLKTLFMIDQLENLKFCFLIYESGWERADLEWGLTCYHLAWPSWSQWAVLQKCILDSILWTNVT